MPDKCMICWNDLSVDAQRRNDDKWFVNCEICGRYLVDEGFSVTVTSRPQDSHLLSGAVRELNEGGQTPSFGSFEELLSFVRVPKNPIEKMDRLLLSLNATQKKMGDVRQFFQYDYPLAYAHDFTELCKIVDALRRRGLLFDHNQSNTHGELTIDGWNRVIELSRKAAVKDQAFVAMPFSAEFDSLYEDGIKPALLETGCSPMRVDKKEHNEKIDDYILAQIKKSRLLVVDFTGQNAGAYFEAGFAMGLGLHVIRTCKNDEYKKLHFDTRQYPHVGWDKPQDLKLVNRINAVAPIKN